MKPNMVKRIIKYIRNAIILIVSLIIIYFLLVILLTLIPVNRAYNPSEFGIEIFITSNEVHIDFVLPVNNEQRSWWNDFPLNYFTLVDSSYKYISFGWGDKDFYLNTPTWADLKWDIALKALFLPTPALMHITYIREKPVETSLTKKIIISDAQYEKLIQYLTSSFHKNEDSSFILIYVPSKSNYENYYEANGSYNFINTCNNWTNQGLKYIGIKTATWAPFDKCVLYHLN